MCSIFKFGNCMGRNYDNDEAAEELFRFIEANQFDNEYRIIGVASSFIQEYPLLYDGMNEEGLCCAALDFPDDAQYEEPSNDNDEIPAYDFVFNILGHCASVDEVKETMDFNTIIDEQYDDDTPNADLHWFVCDQENSIIIEQTNKGLNWYEGEVMTNSPPYFVQQAQYEEQKEDIGDVNMPEEKGVETVYLPGDYTSMGRFQRLSWLKEQMENSDNPFDDRASTYHLLKSVEQIYGVTAIDDKFEYTIYSIVYDMNTKNVILKKYDDSIYYENV